MTSDPGAMAASPIGGPARNDPTPAPGTRPAHRWPRALRDRERLAYPILLILGATDAAGYSVIGPVLPTLRQHTGASTTTISMLAACFPLAMLGGFAAAGRLARTGRTRTALLAGLPLLIAGCALFTLTANLALLFTARTMMGIGSGRLWIAITFRTLQYWPGQEYLCMSRIYAAYSVGALIGPALATLGGLRPPFAAYGLILLICVPLVLALPVPTTDRGFTSDWTVVHSRRFWAAAVAIMFAIMATGTLDGVLPLHLATHLNQAQIGAAYTVTAVLIAIASGAAGNARPMVALTVGGTGIIAGISLVGATSRILIWLPALALIGLGAGAAQTGATGLLLHAVPTDRIVTAMVLWSQMGILGYLIAPALGGPLAAHFRFRWLGLLPLAVATMLTLLNAGRARDPGEPPGRLSPKPGS